MSDLSIIPVQDWFSTQLAQDWNGATGTVYVLDTPSYTPTNTPTYIVVNPWKTNMQIATINAYDSTAKTLTVSDVTLLKGIGINSTAPASSHATGNTVIISDNYQFWANIQTAINSKLDDTGGTMTGLLQFSGTTHAGIKLLSLTTVQRDALSASNGMLIYNSTTGELNQYIGGAWSAVAAGSTQPTASTTVAGKVEIATSAQSIAGTDTGETGALLDVLPSDIAKNIQSATFISWVDAGGDDAYVITITPTLTVLATQMIINFTATTANTGACTLDAWFGGALAIKTLWGNDPANWDVIIGLNRVQYNGTNWTLLRPTTASTAEPWLAEMSTDAEAITGTDETRYVNPKQLKNSWGKSCWQATQTNGSTADLTIAHGLGVTPRLIRMSASRMSGNNNALLIIGSATSTTNESSVYLNASNIWWAGNHATKILYGVNSTPVTSIEADVKTLDATNIVIQWTTMGNPASSTDLIINWEAYA